MPPPFNILSWPSQLVHLFVLKPLVMGANGCEGLRKKWLQTDCVKSCCPSMYKKLDETKEGGTEAERMFSSAFKDTPVFKSIAFESESVNVKSAFRKKKDKRLNQYRAGTLNKKMMSETAMRIKFKRIAEIADQAAENMEKRFGPYDSIAELIDRSQAALIKELKVK